MNKLRWGRVGGQAAAVLIASVVVLAPGRAGAAGGLLYRGPSECPPESAFVAAVDARGGRFEGLDRAVDGRSLEVSIRKAGSGFEGSLQVRSRTGASDAREVHAARCDEVMNGLAVVTAIALGGPAAAPASAAEPPRPAPPEPAPPPGPPDDHQLRYLHVNGVDSIRTDAGTIGVRPAMSISLSGGATFGLIPGVVLPRYDLSISRANAITPPDGRHYIVGNVLRVRVSWLGDATYHATNTAVDAHGLSFGIDLCATPVYDTRGLVLFLCVEYAGGFMSFDAHDALAGTSRSQTTGFGTAGLNSELQYNFSRHLQLDLRVGGDANIAPLTAERADGSQVFKAQPFSGYVLGGLGVHY